MNKNLLHRPIAVSMCVIALMVMSLLALRYIPVSLMPDIDIPQITVQVSMPGYSAQEIEHDVVSPLRGRLMQVAGVTDIRSEARMDAGSVKMTFDPGSNIDLLFIEVNEKIDRAMNQMPKEMDRPKVMKASAMDIPAFFLDVRPQNPGQFAQLSRFARNVIAKRIEQLPQTAMVDMSGTVNAEIECVPDYDKLNAAGITTEQIESAIKKNNITLEALSVVDGLYRYNIHFDSQLLTLDDIANIYINHEGRLLQLKDLCRISEKMADRNGLVRHDGDEAITMAIIKQSDARMEDLQKNMEKLLEDMRKEYPDIRFDVTRDQTQLLSYTLSNLKSNLYAGALLACLILFLFMKEWRLSLLIVLTIPLSLILTLLCFYLFGISLNVVSLSGLILGVGMIVDNSIIVIDNIIARRSAKGRREPLDDNVVQGTREVFTPMLSSVLTTCSVFLPLVFLSGTAGALFYDQAVGVTTALFASLLVATCVIPVYYFALYKKRDTTKHNEAKGAAEKKNKYALNWYRPYEVIMKWVLRHARLCLIVFVCILPLTYFLFLQIEKERMPHVGQTDTLMSIDWNSNISAEENDRRVSLLLEALGDTLQASTRMIGTQEFLLSHTKDITASEAIVYYKTGNEKTLAWTKSRLTEMVHERYPQASVDFADSGNLYDLIFQTGESDLEIRLQDEDGKRPPVAVSRTFIDTLRTRFPDITIMPVMTEMDIRYVADMEQMAVYKVSYEQLYARLKSLLSRNYIFNINDGAQNVPVVIGGGRGDTRRILQETVKNSDGTEIPIAYLVKESKGEDYKRLQAGNGGEYYGISLNASDRRVEDVMRYVDGYVNRHGNHLSASYEGGYFSSRKMIGELSIVLAVALALLFFILAAQFESLVQPFIILLEMVVDVFFVVLGLWLMGESLNVMSMTGIVVMSGIVINDSILKIDTINRYRKSSPLAGGGNLVLTRAVWQAGHSRLRPIVMTSLTTILAILPFLNRGSMGAAIQYPLSLTLIIGMTVGTLVSLFFVPLIYYVIYRKK